MEQFKAEIPGETVITPDLVPELAEELTLNGGPIEKAVLR